VLLALGAAAVWLLQVPSSQPATAVTKKLDTLHARCVQDMVANSCKVMGTGGTSVAAKPGELVFLAGIGPIDAVEYQKMYSAGDAMCTVVRAACASQWNGAQCMTARTLYRQ
jgi:hypothetical protein